MSLEATWPTGIVTLVWPLNFSAVSVEVSIEPLPLLLATWMASSSSGLVPYRLEMRKRNCVPPLAASTI